MRGLLVDEVSHLHGIDLRKLSREWRIERGIELEQAAGNAFGPFHQQYVRDRAPEKVQQILREMRDATRERLERGADPILNARQGFSSMDFGDGPSATVATVANTTTETNLWNPAILFALPVGEIRSGKVWGCEFGGVAGTTATPTLVARARCGTNNGTPPTGTDLGIGATVTLGSFSAQPWFGAGRFVCRTIGIAASLATITGNGYILMPGAAAATVTPHLVFGGAIPTTIDQTVAQGLSVSVAWSAASASNTIACQWVAPYALN